MLTETTSSPKPTFIADCRECYPHGRLIMSFGNQDKREEWAVAHETKLRHKVYRYMRFFPTRDNDRP